MERDERDVGWKKEEDEMEEDGEEGRLVYIFKVDCPLGGGLPWGEAATDRLALHMPQVEWA